MYIYIYIHKYVYILLFLQIDSMETSGYTREALSCHGRQKTPVRTGLMSPLGGLDSCGFETPKKQTVDRLMSENVTAW